MEGGSAIFLLIDCCNNNSGPGAGVWPVVQIWSPAYAAATVTELLDQCNVEVGVGEGEELPIITVDSVSFYFTFM